MDTYREQRPFTIHELKEYTQAFIQQSQIFNQSLAWYDSLVSPWEQNLPDSEPIAVVDLGGTNLRIGIAQSKNNQITWISPILTETTINKHPDVTSFSEWLTSKIVPLAKQHNANKLGFILSYPHQPEVIGPHISAIVTGLSKGLHIPGIVGSNIGQPLLAAAQQAQWPLERLIIINDSIATVLSVYKAKIGLIVGTGGNIAATHPKVPHLRNIEAGNFDAIPHTQASALIDLYEHPQEQSIEKQTTGRYLHQILTYQLLLNSSPLTLVHLVNKLGKVHASRMITNLIEQDYSLFNNYPLTETDKHFLHTISEIVHTTSAQAWALMLSAVININFESLESHPIPIPITGGVILDNHKYQQTIQQTTTQLTNQQVELIPIEDPIRGAAIALLQG